MAEREICDEQNEEARKQMQSTPQKRGTAGFVDQNFVEPWHEEHHKQHGIEPKPSTPGVETSK